MIEKPNCKIPKEIKNVYGIIGRVSIALMESGQGTQRNQFLEEAYSVINSDEAIRVAQKYVNLDR